MKKIILFLALLPLITLNAQIHRFYYLLTYKPDKDSAKTIDQMTVLDIQNKESLYASYDQIAFDSLSTVGIKKMRETGLEFQWDKLGKPPLMSDRVIKNGNEIIHKDIKDFFSCKYKESFSLTWKIESEKMKFNIYDVQKATVTYAGRKWIAWFTTEIPFQDGPYKFFGLPGLIVKIEDDKQNFLWQMVGNKKYNSADGLEKLDYMERQEGIGQLPFLPKKKCIEMFTDYRKNYFNMSMQMFPEVNSELIQRLKEQNKRMQKIFEDNDNFIELTH